MPLPSPDITFRMATPEDSPIILHHRRRMFEDMKEGTAAVRVQVPVEAASYLLNEKRNEIAKIERPQFAEFR